jgi:hypothetical protein
MRSAGPPTGKDGKARKMPTFMADDVVCAVPFLQGVSWVRDRQRLMTHRPAAETLEERRPQRGTPLRPHSQKIRVKRSK